jgi:tetratricopeptide (TPR) repeat protein
MRFGMSQPGKTSKPSATPEISFLFWLSGQGWTSVLICLLLAVITAGVYSHALSNKFVNYDDPDYVTANRHVQTGLTSANVAWAFTTGHASNWHPLTWLSHMLDCQWFGFDENNALPHHRTNIIFHVLNTVLLFLLLRAMTRTVWRCAFVAALFGLHPLHVESVAWISERKDLLSTFFFLLTVGAYLVYVFSRPRSVGILDEPSTDVKEQKVISSSRKAREPVKKEKGPRPTRADVTQTKPQVVSLSVNPDRAVVAYILGILFFALGLMSKPMLVTVPFVLLLLDFWPLRRVTFPEWKESSESPDWLLLEKVPFFGLALASSVITFIVQRKGGAVSTSVSLGERIANALVSYERYIGKMFLPVNLSVLYPHPHPHPWPLVYVFAATAILVGLSMLAVSRARRQPYLLFGWLWFIGMLVPVIGLVQVGIQSMADRYTYIPIIGLFIAITWGLYEFVGNLEDRVPFLWVTALLSLGVCAMLTWRQVSFWHNSVTLFDHATKVTENNYLAYNNLGFALSAEGKTNEAMENYEKSLEINPDYPDALNNVGYALAGQKRFAEAIPHYEKALRFQPNQADVHDNLGNALSELGRTQEAMVEYEKALQLNPEHADAHNNIGIVLAQQGKLDEGIAHFHSAIQFKANYASAHGHLGNALALQHKLNEAIKQYEKCLELNTNDAQAYNNLGNALAEQGNLEESMRKYQRALVLNANNPEAYGNLGIVLARLGQQAEAHYNMALGLALQGKRDEAIAHLKEALRLKPDYPEAKQQLERLSVQ